MSMANSPTAPTGAVSTRPWTIFNPIGVEAWFSAKLTKQAETINERIGMLQANRARYDAALAAAKSEPIENFQFDEALSIGALRISETDVLQDEQRLRVELYQFHEAHHKELCKAADAAAEAHAGVDREVRDALVQLGYKDEAVTLGDPSAIIPLFLMRHPRWRASKSEADALRIRTSTRDAAKMNEDCHRRVLDDLEVIRRRALPS